MTEHEKVAAAIEKSGKQLLGDRVAVLHEEISDTFGNSTIIKAEVTKRKPLSGHIVAMGTGTGGDESNSQYMEVGDKVNFNKYNTMGFTIALEGFDEPVEISVLHGADLYWVL